MTRLLTTLSAILLLSATVRSQQYFHDQLPPGNYSGICAIGNGCFAVVDDKGAEDGFYVFRFDVDTLSGKITEAQNMGYRSSGLPNRDMEGICFFPPSGTVFISGEKDNEVFEYSLDGHRTGRQLNMPAVMKRGRSNLRMEALTYDPTAHQFYVTTERPMPSDTLLRIQAFGDDLQPSKQYLYRPDAPLSAKHKYGVSALCAMGDGRLLVLERQVMVPRTKLNAQTVISIYEVWPGNDAMLTKRLLTTFKTRLTITNRRFANYEGMCALSRNWLLLVADSQQRYKNILRDWFLMLRL